MRLGVVRGSLYLSLCLPILSIVAGCLEPQLVDCGDYLCPLGSTCVAPNRCATPDQLEVCVGQPDGTACSTDAIDHGFCVDGFCLPSICGDGIIGVGEACDDGNTLEGDGCSERCDSREVCGDEIVNGVTGELCDVGVPGLSHDGCSSACSPEFDLWRDITPFSITPRDFQSMIYDPQRNAIVVFGGRTAVDNASDETWLYSPQTSYWTRLVVAERPTARYGAAFVWVPDENRGILFGGLTETGAPLADTWSWSSVGWTKLEPPVSPPARGRAGAAYDELRKELVLVGGYNGTSAFLGDTWLWKAQTWTQAVNAGLAGRYDQAVAYDPVRRYVLMYGGMTVNGATDSTSRWSGTRWEGFSVPQDRRPLQRRNAVLAFDEVSRQQLVLFGGSDAGTVRARPYAWNGTIWRRLDTSATPSARVAAAAASVPGFAGAARVPVILGGHTAAVTMLSDMHWFHGSHWHGISSNESPEPNSGIVATYDPYAGRGILLDQFGAWSWKDGIWMREAFGFGLFAPQADVYSSIAYDERGKRVVFVNARETWFLEACPEDDCEERWRNVASPPEVQQIETDLVFDVDQGRTWLFAATPTEILVYSLVQDAWVRIATTNAPSPRRGFSVSYDIHRKRIVLFGGWHDSPPKLFDETWELAGTAWTQIATTTAPPARHTALQIYDPVRRTTVLFGGANAAALADTWEWNGTAWTARPDFTTPSPRFAAAGFYDRIGARVVLFGGNFELRDTWQYSYVPVSGGVERCLENVDEDHDGMAGCDDPDCWGSCSPLCPPGTCMSSPRCGDTTCDPTETLELCPVDCTCGNTACDPLESPATCPGDCPGCGDTVCDPATETSADCIDCTVCGDAVCDPPEAMAMQCGIDCPP